MAILDIKVFGRHHQIACDDGQESHLRALAKEIDARVTDMSQRMGGQAQESTLLVLTSLMLLDEMSELSQHNEKLKLQLGNSSQSFEKAKRQEIEIAVASAVDEITRDIEKLAVAIENS